MGAGPGGSSARSAPYADGHPVLLSTLVRVGPAPLVRVGPLRGTDSPSGSVLKPLSVALTLGGASVLVSGKGRARAGY